MCTTVAPGGCSRRDHHRLVWHHAVPVRRPSHSHQPHLRLEPGQHCWRLYGRAHSLRYAGGADRASARSARRALADERGFYTRQPGLDRTGPGELPLAVLSTLVGWPGVGDSAHALPGLLYCRDQLVCASTWHSVGRPNVAGRASFPHFYSICGGTGATPGMAWYGHGTRAHTAWCCAAATRVRAAAAPGGHGVTPRRRVYPL